MTLPSIPSVSLDDPKAQAAHDKIREAIQVWNGERGDPLDRAVTVRMLQQDPTLAAKLLNTQYSENPGTLAWALNTITGPSLLGRRVVYPVDLNPALLAKPANLHANGAVINIILDWDLTDETNYDHYEVWRAASDNLSAAVLTGSTQSSVYVDSVGGGGLTYYYWVRGVNTSGLPGPFSDSAHATTGKAGATEIADAVITDRMIAADAAIGGAKIADASITNAKIGQSIQSNNYVTNATGWRLDKTVGLEVNTGTFRVSPTEVTVLDGSGNVILSSGSGVGPAFRAAMTQIDGLGAFSGINNLNAGNISTYIMSAAIGNALIGNAAVDTLQIMGNAVTVPSSVAASSTVSCPSGSATTLLSVTANYAAIAPTSVMVIFSGNLLSAGSSGQIVWFELLRDGTTIADCYVTLANSSSTMTATIAAADAPGIGTHTYSVRSSSAGGTYAVAQRGLVLLGTRR